MSVWRAATGASIIVACLSGGGLTWAQVNPAPYANHAFPPGDYSKSQFTSHDRVHLKNRLKELHDDAVAMQKADGGALTPQHRAELEQRLAVLHKQACAVGLGGKDCPKP